MERTPRRLATSVPVATYERCSVDDVNAVERRLEGVCDHLDAVANDADDRRFWPSTEWTSDMLALLEEVAETAARCRAELAAVRLRAQRLVASTRHLHLEDGRVVEITGPDDCGASG
jgi:hypothetical protein